MTAHRPRAPPYTPAEILPLPSDTPPRNADAALPRNAALDVVIARGVTSRWLSLQNSALELPLGAAEVLRPVTAVLARAHGDPVLAEDVPVVARGVVPGDVRRLRSLGAVGDVLAARAGIARVLHAVPGRLVRSDRRGVVEVAEPRHLLGVTARALDEARIDLERRPAHHDPVVVRDGDLLDLLAVRLLPLLDRRVLLEGVVVVEDALIAQALEELALVAREPGLHGDGLVDLAGAVAEEALLDRGGLGGRLDLLALRLEPGETRPGAAARLVEDLDRALGVRLGRPEEAREVALHLRIEELPRRAD